jgi:hypothetical protein
MILNSVLLNFLNFTQDVIDTLKSLSKPGGPHENTLLLVMGDHGQTLNGDHGGGTAEEVICLVFGVANCRTI